MEGTTALAFRLLCLDVRFKKYRLCLGRGSELLFLRTDRQNLYKRSSCCLMFSAKPNTSPGGLRDKFTHTSPVRSFLPDIFSAPYPAKTVVVTLRRLSKIFEYSRSVILLPVGNRIFCFTNNRGSFLKTITMTVKGAKMCVIVNPKCNQKFDMPNLSFLTLYHKLSNEQVNKRQGDRERKSDWCT